MRLTFLLATAAFTFAVHGASAALIDKSAETTPQVIFGTPDTDILRGGSGNDRLYPGAGGDLVVGNGGDDVVDGGNGSSNLTPNRVFGYADLLTGDGDGSDPADMNADGGSDDIHLGFGMYGRGDLLGWLNPNDGSVFTAEGIGSATYPDNFILHDAGPMGWNADGKGWEVNRCTINGIDTKDRIHTPLMDKNGVDDSITITRMNYYALGNGVPSILRWFEFSFDTGTNPNSTGGFCKVYVSPDDIIRFPGMDKTEQRKAIIAEYFK